MAVRGGMVASNSSAARANGGGQVWLIALCVLAMLGAQAGPGARLRDKTADVGGLTLVGNDATADGSFAAIVVPPAGTAALRWSADGFATTHDATPAGGLRADGQASFAFAGDATAVDPSPARLLTIRVRYHDAGGAVLGGAAATLAYQPAAATFVDLDPAGVAPESVAIMELAGRAIVRGYGDGSGRFGPRDRVPRAQAAALIVRALGWREEEGVANFPDRGGLDGDLWNGVRVLADRGVARGYDDGRFGPNDPVSEAQVVSLIARAMAARGYWTGQPDDPARLAALPASAGHRGDAATFAHYLGDAGGVPGAGADWPTWARPATRGWLALALWRAVQWREGLLTATALPATGTDPTFAGAGDIAGCDTAGDEATARLLDRLPGTVFTLGDNAYPDGTAADFACYDATWGRHRGRTRPAPGNHEYNTPGATGYYGYFGAAAGDPARGYYSYTLGAWHVVALNSNCAAVGGCAAGSPQEAWLRADLAAHPAACTLAYWHHPRFSSGAHGSDPAVADLWWALYDAGADLVLAGHDHHYERFAPQRPDGRADPRRGIREFVVGSGGRSHYGATGIANSEARDSSSYGVLRLTLRPTGYDWRFIPAAGASFADEGSASCH